MKVLPVNYVTPMLSVQKQQKQDAVQPEQNLKENRIFAYQDFNINFTGRTPEDFYEQEFNVKNMPKTMLDYLYQDYSVRRHIPPEQMMNEVFKYLDNAENFGDVKTLYPDEDLFKNLHPNRIKSKKGILAEIKVARELSDKPLLKNGNDDFGMYLLKKIYMEGKTLREINKDFLEKDINDEYKGFITAKADYDTLSAYGIRYPKGAFWHSFIATRDEYKKFFVENMPEYSSQSTEKHSGGSSKPNNSTDLEEPVKPRKHNIKPHRKREIADDIRNTNGDIEQIEKTVVKRFRKDDPEASFIVKYMSPIMTIAAERAHLSEEMKIFTEAEREKGQTVKGKTMFERFWKANPQTLNMFSNAIADTIDMFEDIYNAGGLIPINKDFERIEKGNPNNETIIDFVSEEFFDLLHYTKTIEPERNERYAQHDRMQALLEEELGVKPESHEPESEPVPEEVKPEKSLDEMDEMEQAQYYASQQEGAQIYRIKVKGADDIIFVNNIDKVVRLISQSEAEIFPRKVAAAYVKYVTDEVEHDESYKLIKSLLGYADGELDLKTLENIDDPRVMSLAEYKKIANEDVDNFCMDYQNEAFAASFAMADTLAKFIKNAPDEWFKFGLFDYYGSDSTKDFPEWKDVLVKNRDLTDSNYNYYIRPMTDNESNKAGLQIMNQIVNGDFHNPKSSLDSTTRTILKMLQDTAKSHPKLYGMMREYFTTFVKYNPETKGLLNKNLTKQQMQKRFELIIPGIIADDLYSSTSSLYGIIPDAIFVQYLYQLPANARNKAFEHRTSFFKDINQMSGRKQFS